MFLFSYRKKNSNLKRFKFQIIEKIVFIPELVWPHPLTLHGERRTNGSEGNAIGIVCGPKLIDFVNSNSAISLRRLSPSYFGCK